MYYNALQLCQYGWHEGIGDPTPFIKYLLSMILAAYRDFADRLELVDEKRSSIEIVRKTVENTLGKFTKTDMLERCPTLSKTSVENAIKKLTDEGVLIKHSSGRATFYTRSS